MTNSDPKPVLVSIVTVCLNAEKHVRSAIESVLAQTYADIEYLVVDGGSTDATLDIVRELEPRFAGRMRWVSESDVGLYDAMNKGIGLAAGDLIGIVNADDLLTPEAVATVVATWQAQPEAGVVFGGTCTIDEVGDVVLDMPAPAEVTPEAMGEGMVFCHQSMFVTAETYRTLGTYDTSFRILADYEFVMRCLRGGVVFALADARLSRFRLGGVSGSSTRQVDRERTRIRIRYGANPVVQWAIYARHALASAVYDSLKWNTAFTKAYERRSARK